MTDSVRPSLHPFSHLKAGPTTSSSKSTALPASSTTQPPSRPSSRLRAQRPSARDDAIDATNDKATVALIRRVLCSQTGSHGASSPQPPEALLPPLTSSNDVDRQLYALIAIIIKEFVYSWYSKITPDQALVNEVLQIVAHCTRALEQRLRQVDVAQLVLDEVPALVEAHIRSYRLAKQQSDLSGLPTSKHALYHQLNPHPGFSPVPDPSDPSSVAAQHENETIYRQLLINGALAVLLPTEDLENSSLRTLVSDVFADLILGNEIGGKICEGWFIWETISKLAAVMDRRKRFEDTQMAQSAPHNRLEKFGLLLAKDESPKTSTAAQSLVVVWIWNGLQCIWLGYIALRFIATGLFRVASSPRRESSHRFGVPLGSPIGQKHTLQLLSNNSMDKRPILSYRLCSMLAQLLGVPHRMPWLSGVLSLFQYLVLAGPGRLGETDGVFDRFLRESIEAYVLAPTLLPTLLLTTRAALFPANACPPPEIVDSQGPASTLQVSVQPRTATQKASTGPSAPGYPIVEGARTTDSVSEPTDKSNGGNGSNQNNRLLPAASLTSSAANAAANISTSPSSSIVLSGADKKKATPSSAEIATIRRQCAASLLAVIPRSVARRFFGVSSRAAPAVRSSDGDGSCSMTTTIRGSSSPTTTVSFPPASLAETTSDHVHLSFQKKGPIHSSQQNSSLSSLSSSSSSSNIPPTPGLDDDDVAATPLSEDATTSQPNGSALLDDPEELCLQAIEDDLLDVFADEYCNKHLVYSIIETVLAKLLPELAERSVVDLMEDRGVSFGPVG